MFDWKAEREQRFPKALLSAAQAAERATGVPACLTIAQWAWESAWGSKTAGSNNYFGMKWRDGCGFPFNEVHTHEFINGVSVPVVDKFIAFPSLEAACEYHGKLLSNPKGPYKSACQFLHRDWRKFVETVCPIYATDPEYLKAIIGLIEKYHLYDFNLPVS